MEDFGVNGYININLKDKDGNVKYNKTVKNKISDIARQLFLYNTSNRILKGLTNCGEDAAYIDNRYNKFKCFNTNTGENAILQFDAETYGVLKQQGCTNWISEQYSGDPYGAENVLMCPGVESSGGVGVGDRTSPAITSPLLQFTDAVKYNYKLEDSALPYNINCIAMVSNYIGLNKNIKMFNYKSIDPTDFLDSKFVTKGTEYDVYIMPPDIVYNRGQADEVVWTYSDEIIIYIDCGYYLDESGNRKYPPAFSIRLLTGEVTAYEKVTDRFSFCIASDWKSVCFLKVYGSDYDTPLAYTPVYNYLYYITSEYEGIKYAQVTATNISEGKVLYNGHILKVNDTTGFYKKAKPRGNKVSLYTLRDHLYAVLGYSYYNDNGNVRVFAHIFDYKLLEDGEVDLSKDLGNLYLNESYSEEYAWDIPGFKNDYPSISYYINSGYITQIGSSYVDWYSDYDSIPKEGTDNEYILTAHLVGKEFVYTEDVEVNEAVKYTGRVFSTTIEKTFVRDESVYPDIYDQVEAFVSRVPKSQLVFSTPAVTFSLMFDKAFGYGDTPRMFVAGPNWCGNVYSMHVLDEPFQFGPGETLDITYMYTIGDSTEVGVLPGNTDGNNIQSP